MRHENTPDNVPEGPDGRPTPIVPPTPAAPPPTLAPRTVPHAGYALGVPGKKKWWSMPKVLAAAGAAVLLAGGGGAAIGYSVGQSDATHQFGQRFQNGRPNGANGQARRSPGPVQGQVQPTAPGTPGTNGNP